MWPSVTGRDVLQALSHLGWQFVRQTGSHRNLRHPARCAARLPNATYPFAYSDRETVGAPALAKLTARMGLDRDAFLAALR